MKTKYNGVEFDTLNLYLENDNLGLMPNSESQESNPENLDGVFDNPGFFKEREFSLECKLVCENKEDHLIKLAQVAHLFWTYEDRPLIIAHRPDRYINCMINGKIEHSLTGLHTALSIPMVAVDPFFYSIQQHSSSPGVVVNLGNFETRPIIIIHGIAVNPIININGALMTYEGALSNMDSLVIDTYNRTVYFNGHQASAYFNRIYVGLKPGGNTVTCSSGTCTIFWRDCWL